MTMTAPLLVFLEILRALVWPGQHEQPGQFVLSAPEQLKAAWVADGGAASDLPKVDFEQEMVLAVFAGQKNTGGHAVKIQRVVQAKAGEQTQIVVLYRETAPGPDMMVTQALTYPSHVVVVPKRAGEVSFQKADSPAAAELLREARPQK